MRATIYAFIFSAIALMVLVGCNSAEQKNGTKPIASASPAGQVPNDGARRVTTTELQQMLANNQAVVIDVRNEASYNAGHIRGSKLIPEADLPNHLSELPKDKLIVTYCS